MGWVSSFALMSEETMDCANVVKGGLGHVSELLHWFVILSSEFAASSVLTDHDRADRRFSRRWSGSRSSACFWLVPHPNSSSVCYSMADIFLY